VKTSGVTPQLTARQIPIINGSVTRDDWCSVRSFLEICFDHERPLKINQILKSIDDTNEVTLRMVRVVDGLSALLSVH
jgi:hypothetical protein